MDVTAQHIVGDYLMVKNKTRLYRLAKSEDLWERRIAVMATFYFIKHKKYEETLKIAKILLNDKEDLVHKAVGWMLHEIGKKDMTTEETFLKPHYKEMPRTMLRYAIEKFPEPKRQKYLKGSLAPSKSTSRNGTRYHQPYRFNNPNSNLKICTWRKVFDLLIYMI